MFDLSYMIKTYKANQKWQALPYETRVILNISFRDALHRPNFVGDYFETTYEVSGVILTIYYFGIGYAAFKLAQAQDFQEYILVDFDFQDGAESFEVLHPAAI